MKTEWEQSTPVDWIMSLVLNSMNITEDDRHLKKAIEYDGQNVVNRITKMKTIIWVN